MRKVGWVGGIAVTVGALATVLLIRGDSEPPRLAADSELEAMRIVDAYLPTVRSRLTLEGKSFPEPGPRQFCTRQVFESRLEGADTVIGLAAHCVGYYAGANGARGTLGIVDDINFGSPDLEVMRLTVSGGNVSACLIPVHLPADRIPSYQCGQPELTAADYEGLGPAGYTNSSGDFYELASRDDYKASLRKLFSPAGYEYVLAQENAQWPDLPSPEADAKRWFGLPENAPVR